MKKLGILFLVLSLGVLPFKAGAMYRVDENGNPIEYEDKPGEYHIMLADEGATGSGTTGQTEETMTEEEKLAAQGNVSNDVDPVAPDQSVSNEDKRDVVTDAELYYANDTGVRTLAENSTTENTTDKDNTVFYAVGSGVLGMSLGAALVYFLTKKH